MNTAELTALLDRLRAEPREAEWLEFKANRYEPQLLGEYLSALATSACLLGKPRAYLVFGIEDGTHAVVGTTFDQHAEKGKGEHPKEATARVQAAHAAAPAHRPVPRPGREGRGVVLRQEGGERDAVDEEALDLRPAHQPALHAQDLPAPARGPGRVRAPVQRGEPPRPRADVERRESPQGRWRAYEASELMARDKASLDIVWLRDETLADSDNLPPPDVTAQEIVDDLEAALEQFRLIAGELSHDL